MTDETPKRPSPEEQRRLDALELSLGTARPEIRTPIEPEGVAPAEQRLSDLRKNLGVLGVTLPESAVPFGDADSVPASVKVPADVKARMAHNAQRQNTLPMQVWHQENLRLEVDIPDFDREDAPRFQGLRVGDNVLMEPADNPSSVALEFMDRFDYICLTVRGTSTKDSEQGVRYDYDDLSLEVLHQRLRALRLQMTPDMQRALDRIMESKQYTRYTSPARIALNPNG